jgi:hypothetical protein
MKMDKHCLKHVKALNLNKSESESKVCIKLVVLITYKIIFNILLSRLAPYAGEII